MALLTILVLPQITQSIPFQKETEIFMVENCFSVSTKKRVSRYLNDVTVMEVRSNLKYFQPLLGFHN